MAEVAKQNFNMFTSDGEWFWSPEEDVDADPFSELYGYI